MGQKWDLQHMQKIDFLLRAGCLEGGVDMFFLACWRLSVQGHMTIYSSPALLVGSIKYTPNV